MLTTGSTRSAGARCLAGVPGFSMVAALAALAALAGCGGAAPGTTAPRPPLVEAVEARRGALPLEELVQGVVRAENQVAVRTEISAIVAEVLVGSGDAVRKGQVLVRLRDDELREQVRRAEADLRLAEATAAEAQARTGDVEARVARLRRLAEDDLVSPQELDSLVAQLAALRAATAASEAGVEQARATVDERRSALEKTVVRSPVGGRVGERRVEAGMLAAPDTFLFRVGNLARVVVDVTLTEKMLEHVRAGQPVLVRPRDSGSEPIVGTLARVSPFLAEDSFTTVGEIDLDNPDGRLLPGTFVTARVLFGSSEEATLIPTSALWEDPSSGERGVFVVDDADGLEAPAGERAENPERAREVSFRRVDVRAEGRGSVGVDGLADGAWVVIAGQHLLRRNLDDAAIAGTGTGSTTEARIRPTTWERVEALQGLQREDLLEGFLDKQQRVARTLGADIPESESIVQRALGDDAAAAARPDVPGDGDH